MAAIAKATSALPGVAEKSDAGSSGGGESSGGISLSGIKFSDKGLCPDLTITQRFGGFLACFGLGIFFFMMALMAISMLKTAAFAFYFVVSSCAWLGSSCFVVGPKKQFANMKQPKRRNCAGDPARSPRAHRSAPAPAGSTATRSAVLPAASACPTAAPSSASSAPDVVCVCAVACLVCIILTLVVVFLGLPFPFGFILCFIFGCAQFCTFWYYMLSYIPYGRAGARFLWKALWKKVGSG